MRHGGVRRAADDVQDAGDASTRRTAPTEGSVMSSTRGRVRPSRERLYWAGSLVALAVSGMLAAARFADQAAAFPGSSAPDCDVASVAWGYEVELSPGTGSYSVAGTHFDRVPPGCDGAAAVILYRDEREVQHRSQVVLAPGLVDRLDADVWTTHSLVSASWGIVPGT